MVKKRIKQFANYVDEKEKEHGPYRLLILSNNDIHDPNRTGPLIAEKAKEMNLEVFAADYQGAWTEVDENGQRWLHSFPVGSDGTVPLPTGKEPIEYAKPFKMDPTDTLIMNRGIHIPGVTGNQSWYDMSKIFEHEGYTMINSTECHLNCSSKWMNQILFERHKINTPKTVIISHKEGAREAFERLDSDFPLILKTSNGSRGVGVIWVESKKSLEATVQLLYRENEYIDVLLQEYIETKYDVRAIVVAGDVVGSMKRPVPPGDFRSNVAQGSEPVSHELTQLEIDECIKAAKSVDGLVTGVDFIPANDRERDKPFFIEVNSTPGLIGIEEVLQKKFSITTEILKKFFNRTRWKDHPAKPDRSMIGPRSYKVKNTQGV